MLTLKDFDWSARITLASDNISGLRTPLVILKLFLTSPDGITEERILELSQLELDSLLNNLIFAKHKIKENFKSDN